MASTLRMRGQLLLASLSAATSQITESRIDPAEINDERLGWFNLVPRVRVTLQQRTGKIIPEVPLVGTSYMIIIMYLNIVIISGCFLVSRERL